MEKINIRKIRDEELPVIKNFPPDEWNLDLEKLYRKYFNLTHFESSASLDQ